MNNIYVILLLTLIAIFSASLDLFSSEEISNENSADKEYKENEFLKPFIVQVIGFVILSFLLIKFVFPFISASLRKRKNAIKDAYDSIDKSRSEVESLTEEYRQRMANLNKEIESIMKSAVEDGKKMQDEIINEAQKIAEMVIKRVEREVELQKDGMIVEVKQKIVAEAIDYTRKLLSETFDNMANASYLEKSFSEIERVSTK